MALSPEAACRRLKHGKPPESFLIFLSGFRPENRMYAPEADRDTERNDEQEANLARIADTTSNVGVLQVWAAGQALSLCEDCMGRLVTHCWQYGFAKGLRGLHSEAGTSKQEKSERRSILKLMEDTSALSNTLRRIRKENKFFGFNEQARLLEPQLIEGLEALGRALGQVHERKTQSDMLLKFGWTAFDEMVRIATLRSGKVGYKLLGKLLRLLHPAVNFTDNDLRKEIGRRLKAAENPSQFVEAAGNAF